MFLRGMCRRGTVRGYGGLGTGYGGAGAVGTVEGYGGYSGGVRWVRWRGAVGTVDGCGGYGGRVRWVRCQGTVGTGEGYGWCGGRVMVEGFGGYGGKVQQWVQWRVWVMWMGTVHVEGGLLGYGEMEQYSPGAKRGDIHNIILFKHSAYFLLFKCLWNKPEPERTTWGTGSGL